MIYGIGTDIVEIVRIKDAAEKWGEHFLRRIYTQNELDYCYKKKDPFPHLAARFAAKEAFIKALTDDSSVTPRLLHSKTLNLKDIEVLNHSNGKPFVRLHIFNGCIPGLSFNTHLSISHERKYAVANVVIEV